MTQNTNIAEYNTKIVRAILSCKTIDQFESVLKMISLYESKFGVKIPKVIYEKNKFYIAIQNIK